MKISQIFGKIVIFLKEAKTELKRVNWLTKREAVRYTLIVIVISVICAIFLGTLDYLFLLFLDRILH